MNANYGFGIGGHSVRRVNCSMTTFGTVWATALANVAYYGETLVTTQIVDDWAGSGVGSKRIGRDRASTLLNERLWPCGTFKKEIRIDRKSANGKSFWAVPGRTFDQDYQAAAERGLLSVPSSIAPGRLDMAYDEGREAGLKGTALEIHVAMRARTDSFGNYWGTLQETADFVSRRQVLDEETDELLPVKSMHRSTALRAIQRLTEMGMWEANTPKGMRFIGHNQAQDEAPEAEIDATGSTTCATRSTTSCNKIDRLMQQDRPGDATGSTTRPRTMGNNGSTMGDTVVDHHRGVEADASKDKPLEQAAQDQPLDEQISDEPLDETQDEQITCMEWFTQGDAQGDWTAVDYFQMMEETHDMALKGLPWGLAHPATTIKRNVAEWLANTEGLGAVDMRDLMMAAAYYLDQAVNGEYLPEKMAEIHHKARNAARSTQTMQTIHQAFGTALVQAGGITGRLSAVEQALSESFDGARAFSVPLILARRFDEAAKVLGLTPTYPVGDAREYLDDQTLAAAEALSASYLRQMAECLDDLPQDLWEGFLSWEEAQEHKAAA